MLEQSEIAVIADDTAFADEVAADLLSQAEHDKMACAILVTTSEQLAHNVALEVEKQLATLPREEVARASIENFGAIYIAETMSDAVEAINSLAPEHLEIVTKNAEAVAEQVRHAGGIFIGRYSFRACWRLFCWHKPCATNKQHSAFLQVA
ncbi:Histidinol dehydrogenase OS=Lysinibacillus sphaericus OX=1421 GN=hisD PE=3 SV=1 [Lysinibacillus sphaericus]